MLCTKQSEIPYYIQSADINIYSLEELCYYLYNNLYFVDKEFFNQELCDYLKNELKQETLSQKLAYQIYQNARLTEMISLILLNGVYYSKEEINKLSDVLKEIGNKSVAQRLKVRADKLLSEKKYKAALKIYQDYIGKIHEKVPSKEEYAKVYNNMGVIYTRLFLFEEAAENFKKSLVREYSKQHFDNLVIALLMDNKEEEVALLLKEYNIKEDVIESIRNKIKEKEKEIKETNAYKSLISKVSFEGKESVSDYYGEVQTVIDKWKLEYREEMAF